MYGRRSAATVLVLACVTAGGGAMAQTAGPADSQHVHLEHTASHDGVAAANQRAAHRAELEDLHRHDVNATRAFRQSVTPEAIERHLAALQDIADKNDGNRAAGTPGYEASASYVQAVLRQAGYQPRRQYFDFVYEQVKKSSLTQNAPGKETIAQTPFSYSPSTPAEGITADVVVPSSITGCAEGDFAGAKGRIVLIQRGTCTFAVKAQNAAKAGALGAVIYNNTDGDLNGTLGAPGDNYVPVTGVTKAAGEKLAAAAKASGLNLTLVLDKITEKRRTFNIVAETRGGADDNVVMAGAHLDSVQQGPGINDNGSGTAAILEVAVQLAKQKHLNNKVRFAWWGAEELGLLGSEHYVEDLKTKQPQDLKRIATYLNFDMVGSPNPIIGVYDADQSTYEAPVDVPKGSIETEKVLTDYFDGQGQAWVDTEFSGRSDYDAFIKNGVPASGLFTGAEGKKSKGEQLLFGGQEGKAYDPNYHEKGDTLANVSMRAVDINSDAIAHTMLTLARSTKDINGRS